MKSGDLLFSSVQFLFVALLIVLGLFLIGVGVVPEVYQKFLLLIERGSWVLMGIGAISVALGLLLLSLFCWMHKGQYYVVQLPPYSAQVDRALIEQSVLRYLSSLDLSYPVDCEVVQAGMKKLSLRLLTAALPRKERKYLLSLVEQDLPKHLAEHLGYDQPLTLCVYFS